MFMEFFYMYLMQNFVIFNPGQVINSRNEQFLNTLQNTNLKIGLKMLICQREIYENHAIYFDTSSITQRQQPPTTQDLFLVYCHFRCS